MKYMPPAVVRLPAPAFELRGPKNKTSGQQRGEIRAIGINDYPKIREDFGSASRRIKGRVVGLCNA